MDKTLVIVESPAKAKTIGRYLGKDYEIAASVGHIRDLPSSTMGVDINNDFKPRYINMRGKEKIINDLKAKAAANAHTLIATDPDREGEAIAWHLANVLHIDPLSLCRITFNEITKNTVKTAVEQPRAIDLDLVNAQQARRILDRLVGYELSPLLWSKVKKGLSAGRVQSVATLMLVEREEAIRSFEPQEYWLLSVHLAEEKQPLADFTAQFYGRLDTNGKCVKEELPDASAVENIKKQIQEPYKVLEIVKRNRQRNPAPPYTTSTLQQDAARKLGFSAKKTMLIAQQLYEGVDLPELGATALVTYIRTDSVRSSADAVAGMRKIIESTFGPEFVPAEPNHFKNKNAAQDAHEAIRPSHLELPPEKIKVGLSTEQYKLYRLIWERFLASQMTPAKLAATTINIAAGDIIFRVTGETVIFPGFLKVNPEKVAEKEMNILPDLEKNETLRKLELLEEQKFTQPPARYNEASLIKAMEEAGIGRPSTYAPTLSTIMERQYAVKENKSLIPTELGFLVTNILREHFKKLINIKFTAEMENDLDEVESGKLNWVELIKNFYPVFHAAIVKAQKDISKIVIPVEATGEKCPECGADLVIKEGRFGKFIACSAFPNCKFTKNAVEKVDGHCPRCGSDLVSRRSRRGSIFYVCSQNADDKNCDFISWDLPVDNEKCPECGSYMVWHRLRGRLYKRCSNDSCVTRKSKRGKTDKNVAGEKQANDTAEPSAVETKRRKNTPKEKKKDND